MSLPKVHSACAILIAHALSSLAAASEHEAHASLKLADVLHLARERNPEIAAARARADAARHVPARVAALADPTLSWEAWNTPESFDVTEADNNIFKVTQRFPFPGKLGLARDGALREADSASADAKA
ncbi:MAG: TolC family protein, partial [Candidatus Binatia bacterium]